MRYRVVDFSFLIKRGRVWWYDRRVPKRYTHLDTRARIRQSLETALESEALVLRDRLASADDEYWTALALAENRGGPDSERQSQAALLRYRSARTRALAAGFDYRPVEALAREGEASEIVDRLLEVRDRSGPSEVPKPCDAEAILGGVEAPGVTTSQAFEIYLNEIAFDEQKNKSPKQRYSWEKTKRTSINYFIEVIGDVAIEEISRGMALSYRSWWIERMIPGKSDQGPAKPNTANRHIGNMRKLYEDYFVHIGNEDRLNPFRKMFFKDDQETKVPPFEDQWVRDRILRPGLFDALNDELRLMIYVLIETGARISEICNLQPEQIRLDSEIPHIEIKAIDRELKTVTSKREIPLVGVALEGMRAAPNGFPKYRDKGELVSANLMKAFRFRELFPTTDHVIYSFRHAFEDRMLEAGIDYGMRCYLMGHKNDRPDYGTKGSLGYRRDQLMKILHPFDPAIFTGCDGEHASSGLVTSGTTKADPVDQHAA